MTRGLRLNNAGNIRHSRDSWQGKSKDQPDKSFVKFDSPVYGIRALARVLLMYFDKHKLRTIRGIISRWAPPIENDSQSYIRAVGVRMERGVDFPLDLHKYSDIEPLVKAIIWHENGSQPYTQAQIDKGLTLAGIEPEKKPLAKTRTGIGGIIAAITSALNAGVEYLKEQLEPFSDFKWVQIILLTLTLGGIALVLYARWDDARRLFR